MWLCSVSDRLPAQHSKEKYLKTRNHTPLWHLFITERIYNGISFSSYGSLMATLNKTLTILEEVVLNLVKGPTPIM